MSSGVETSLDISEVIRDSSPSLGMTRTTEGCDSLFYFISRDLQQVAVGIVKINRVRNFVILEFEFDASFFQFALRGDKIFPVCPKSEVKNSELAVT